MRLAPLAGIIIIAWLLVIAEAYMFFQIIIPFAPPVHVLGSLTLLALLKVVMTFALGILWFVVIVSLSRIYVRSKLRRQPPTSSS